MNYYKTVTTLDMSSFGFIPSIKIYWNSYNRVLGGYGSKGILRRIVIWEMKAFELICLIVPLIIQTFLLLIRHP